MDNQHQLSLIDTHRVLTDTGLLERFVRLMPRAEMVAQELAEVVAAWRQGQPTQTLLEPAPTPAAPVPRKEIPSAGNYHKWPDKMLFYDLLLQAHDTTANPEQAMQKLQAQGYDCTRPAYFHQLEQANIWKALRRARVGLEQLPLRVVRSAANGLAKAGKMPLANKWWQDPQSVARLAFYLRTSEVRHIVFYGNLGRTGRGAIEQWRKHYATAV